MKTTLKHVRWLIAIMLLVIGTGAMAQPYLNSGDHSVCFGSNEPYGVTFTPGSSYDWSVIPLIGGNGTINLVPGDPNLITVDWNALGTATLQLLETNSLGCFVTVSITVTINATPVLVITDPAPVCSPSTVDLTDPAVTAGSTLNGATLTYWEDAAATIALANPNAVALSGIYYIQAGTGAGCSDIQPVEVIINPSPVLVITNPLAVCQPLTVDITVAAVTAGSTLPAGTVLTYWEDIAATTPVADPAAIAVSGTYYIQASAGACSDIEPVVVIVNETPILVITDPAPVCSPSTVDITAAAVTAGSTLNGATLTYWEDAAATIVLANPATIAVSGTYYIQAGTAAGCSVILPVVVEVNPSPVLVITNPLAVCQPGTVDITAAAVTVGSTLPAGTVLTYWEDALATLPLANPATIAVSGTYYIQAETAEGCSAIEPVEVVVNPTPVPVIVGVSPVCENDIEVYSVTDNPGNSYVWVVVGGTIDLGQGTNQITVTWTTPTAGSVEVTETAGTCSDTDTMIIVINAAPTTTTIYHN